MNKTEENLQQIHQYLREYNRLANELAEHYQDEEFNHRLRLLEEHILVFKQNLEAQNLTEKQRQQKFLDHHFMTLQLTNLHLHQIRHQLEYSYLQADLEKLRCEMEKIAFQLQATQEPTCEYTPTLTPFPRPGGSFQGREENNQ